VLWPPLFQRRPFPGGHARLPRRLQPDKPGFYAAGNVDEKARAQLNWCVRSGKWEIRSEAGTNGVLFGVGGPAVIFCERPVATNFRVEYTTWSPNPGDRSVYVPFHAELHLQGHLPVPVGRRLQHDQLHPARGDKTGREQDELAGAREEVPVIIQKIDDQLDMSVDGASLFSVKDAGYERVRDELSGMQGCASASSPGPTACSSTTWRSTLCPAPGRRRSRRKRRRSTRSGRDSTARRREGHHRRDRSGGVELRGEFPQRAVRGVQAQAGRANAGRGLLRGTEGRQRGRERERLLTLATPPLKTGEVEVELLAKFYEGECATLSLLNGQKAELAAVSIGADGTFYAKTAEGVKKLKDRISYLNRRRMRACISSRNAGSPSVWASTRLTACSTSAWSTCTRVVGPKASPTIR